MILRDSCFRSSIRVGNGTDIFLNLYLIIFYESILRVSSTATEI